MYLEHFKMEKPPFSLTPNTQFFCSLPSYESALNVLLYSIHSGEGFIKITGEVGSGKTLLCRQLLKKLNNNFVTAYIPTPDLSPDGLRRALAKELGIEYTGSLHGQDMVELLTEKLLSLNQSGKSVILIIDEAQLLPSATLEALRLLTNLETESDKLIQIVLFGQSELDTRLDQHELRPLKQRISFSHQIMPLDYEDMSAYVDHRLTTAGCEKTSIFSQKAYQHLHQYSQGIPRLINILCHKALLIAYGQGKYHIDHHAVKKAATDTDLISQTASYKRKFAWGSGLFLFASFSISYYCYLNAIRLTGKTFL